MMDFVTLQQFLGHYLRKKSKWLIQGKKNKNGLKIRLVACSRPMSEKKSNFHTQMNDPLTPYEKIDANFHFERKNIFQT